MIKLRPYQEKVKADIYSEWEKGKDNVLAVLPTGGGKCLGKDTPVLMYDGSIKMVQDVVQGDKLMGPDSTPRNVLSTCTGVSELFKITPVKGDPWVCNDAHILSLFNTRRRDVVDIPIKEYLKRIEKAKRFKTENLQFTVGVDFKHSEVKEDPYLIGMKSRWEGEIPNEYLVNSDEVRLQVAAGIIDHYGNTARNVSVRISVDSDQLLEDYTFLFRSLGFNCTVNDTIGFKGKNKIKRINIRGNFDELPLSKKEMIPRKNRFYHFVTGFKVESIGQGDYYGFEIDGDRRFLLGDFTVTHNTTIFCTIAKEHGVDGTQKIPTAIMVHRKELVQQISLTLCRMGIVHNIIAPQATIKQIISAQRRLHGKQFYNYSSAITVLSVDTLNARAHKHESWASKIRLWITDEAHHVLADNKWGKALKLFKNAKGLGVTATPERLDKKGLGSHADGVFDTMVSGPEVKWMINQEFLCRWKAAVPRGDYTHFLGEKKGNSDYTAKQMEDAANKSQIVGDVVENYIRFAKGKQTILFAPTISIANRMCDEFIAEGVSAQVLTGNDTDKDRLEGMLKFENKETQVLLNVDLFDEGLDVPGIECVILARPTMSLGKYRQMIGRGLRPAPNKEFLLIIDHAGNIKRHLYPDAVRDWTLDRIKGKRKAATNMIKICENVMCAQPYERFLPKCPWCGHAPEPKGGGERVPPEEVDGDLLLLDPWSLEEMNKATVLELPEKVAERVMHAAGVPASIKAARNQQERIDTQAELSEAIATWAGKQKYKGLEDRSIHKLFYLKFGKTIAQSLALTKADMKKLIEKIGDEK